MSDTPTVLDSGRPSPGFTEFVKEMLRHAADGLGLPRDMLIEEASRIGGGGDHAYMMANRTPAEREWLRAVYVTRDTPHNPADLALIGRGMGSPCCCPARIAEVMRNLARLGSAHKRSKRARRHLRQRRTQKRRARK